MRKTEPIAIIGMGCRFPGAGDLEGFWQLLRRGVDAVEDVPSDRWDAEALWDPFPGAAGKISSRRGGFLHGLDLFDAGFFGISRGEADNLDPQQRLLLEVVWEAFEDSALSMDRFAGSRTSVFIGIGSNDYASFTLGDAGKINAYALVGGLSSIASNRISNFFDLRGSSLSLDTACSSSLLAVHLACRSLIAGDADMAVAGGVNVILWPNPSVAMSQSWILSPEGRCKAFDAAADGYVRGEGCGIVILKRLSEAIRDGDPVHAVIRGSAANQDGRGQGLTVPNSSMHQAAIQEALEAAGILPEAVDYIEAHGIGSLMTDNAELQALSAVMAGRSEESPCLIGSVKTNIGHLESASGIAALLKVVLSLEHGFIPPNLHLEHKNPLLASSRVLDVPTALTQWPSRGSPRLAGVNSFGIGGTNVHVVVEEAAPARFTESGADDCHLLTLSARTPKALSDLAARYASYLASHPDRLDDFCFTVNTTKTVFNCRAAVSGKTAQELIDALSHLDAEPIEEAGIRFRRGEPVDWAAYYRNKPRHRIPVPAYPFQRQRYWYDRGRGPQTEAMPSPATSHIALPANYDAVLELVRREVSDVLGLANGTELDDTRGLFAQGMTSLMAVELNNRLRRSLGSRYAPPPTALFDFPTVEKLARFIGHDILSLEIPPEKTQKTAAAPRLDRSTDEPIAIVGVACRFPGGADSPESFWELLKNGVDAVREVPASRWNIDEYYDPDPDTPGKMYTRSGGFIDGVDQFDAGFFGIAPRELVSMDPQQRLILEVAWEALESAGINPHGLENIRTGIMVGIGHSDYASLIAAGDLSRIDPYLGTGTLLSAAAGRLAYVLGIHGPALIVDTACSSSLVALHLASQSLRARECDVVVTGGVNLILAPESTIALSRARALSPDGRCRTFDAGANGYVRGEGCGLIILKRLSDAERDHDHILAIVRGSAVNHDGASGGFTVPNGLAQQTVVREALRAAHVEPREIGYVEAHGTGTALGDPIEVHSLMEVLREQRTQNDTLLLGSVKTNIGHLESAAGIAGLIKVVLSLQHREIPPHLHFEKLNPLISWNGVPVTVPTRCTSWPEIGGRRIAGISSFGLTGTNAHVVIEQAPEAKGEGGNAEEREHVVTLSARSEAALQALVERYGHALSASGTLRLGDAAWTANVGRAQFKERAAVVGNSCAEVGEKLKRGEYKRGRAEPGRRVKVGFLFSGQGSQYVGMGRELYESEEEYRQWIDKAAGVLEEETGRKLLEVMWGRQDGLDETEWTQPALYAVEYALAQQWKQWGVEAAAVMGHSIGEYAAAAVAGVLEWEQGLRLVARRGRMMQRLGRGGGMAAVYASGEEVERRLRNYAGRVTIAAWNGREQVTIAGEEDGVEALSQELRAEGRRVERLRVSEGFHSQRMEPMLEELEREIGKVERKRPERTLVLNLTGEVSDGEEIRSTEYWRRQAREAVRFEQGVKRLAAEVDVIVEVGPAPVLLGLGMEAVEKAGLVWTASLSRKRKDRAQMLEAAAELYVAGVNLDWDAIDGRQHKVVLPTYPFQRQRYWTAPPEKWRGRAAAAAEEVPRARSGDHLLLGTRLRSVSRDIQFEAAFTSTSPAFIADHRIFGMVVVPAACYIVMAIEAAQTLKADACVLEELIFPEALVLPDGVQRAIQFVLTPPAQASYAFQIASTDLASDTDDTAWTLHASGSLKLIRPESAAEELEARESYEGLTDEAATASRYYEIIAENGIQLGPSFQWIEKIYAKDGDVVAKMRLPRDDEFKGLVLHPGLIDSCFQLLAAFLPGTGDGDPWIPIGMDELRFSGKPVWPLWCRARREDSGIANETLTASLQLYDSRHRLVAEMRRLHLKRAPRAALMRALKQDISQSLYRIEWRPKSLDRKTVTSKRFLILGSDIAFANQIAADAAARGCECAVDGEQARAAFAATDILLVFTDSTSPLEAGIENCCRQTLEVIHELAASTAMERPRVWMVTRGTQQLPGDGAPVLSTAPLLGISRTAALELADLWGGMIDLGFVESKNDPAAVVDEILVSTEEDSVAYRNGTRYVPRLSPAAWKETRPMPIKKNATYLITGGLGALGLETARWLATRGVEQLVLAGRRPPSPDVAARIEAIERTGTHVRCEQVDVADYAALSQVFADIDQNMPPLAGIIHAAGTLDDGVLNRLRWERFAPVLAPKINGAWNLHRLTQHRELDFFVLFSSIASIFGSAGQANYAAANAFMDSLARYRKSEGLPALSINWGPWAGAGMAADAAAETQRRREAQGWTSLSVSQGLEILDHLLADDSPQLAAFRLNWDQMASRISPGQRPPLLAEMLDFRASGISSDREELARRIDAAKPADRPAIVAGFVQEKMARVLGLESPDRVDVNQPVNEMGMDSLMALELTKALSSAAGRKLPATLLFNYPTVEALSSYLLDTLAPAAPGALEATVEKQESDVARITQEVDKLSQAEVESLLDQELASLDEIL